MTLAGKENGSSASITVLIQQMAKIIPICFIIFISTASLSASAQMFLRCRSIAFQLYGIKIQMTRRRFKGGTICDFFICQTFISADIFIITI